MNVFFLDLWHDLREKRLAPVAILLAAALLAVPFVLREKAEAPAVAPTSSATPSEGTAKTLAVKALEESEVPSSDLGLFDPKNPFKPLQGGEKQSVADGKVGVPEQAGTTESSGGGAGGGGKDAVAATEGGGGGGGSGAPADTPADSGSGGGGGGTGGDAGGGQAPPSKKTERYTYVVDLTFERNGRTRKIKGMRRLHMLPNEARPLLIFLGVSARGDNAVFLVDSSLTGAGEGKCKPNANECGILYLGPGSEHEFRSEEGDSLALRVDQIRRVKVRAAKANKSRKKRKQPADAKREKPADASANTRRFVLGDLIDVVEVESSTRGDSGGGKPSR